MISEKKLFLLDAMALIYRAFYALNKNPRINSKGLNTSAILGFTNTLRELLNNEKPTHIGVAFDSFAPTIRHEEFSEYKANRKEMPEDLSISLPYIKEIIKAFRIPILEIAGFEADDIIGTMAKKAEQNGFFTYMVTPDKDFGQLISENIFMYKPARMGNKPEIIGVKEVCEKYELKKPEQMIDLLGLMGDSSDNIPGIPGIGEVTAKKLLAQFHTVENLIAQAEHIENERIKNKVIEHKNLAIQSKMLATIILDVPVEFDEKQLLLKDPDLQSIKLIFEELEFRQLSKTFFSSQSQAIQPVKTQKGMQTDLFGNTPDTPGLFEEIDNRNSIENTEHKYYYTDTPEKRKNLIKLLQTAKNICFDTETTGLDPITSELVGISFCIKPGEAWFVPCPENQEETQSILHEFKDILENPEISKIGQNLKFDINILKKYKTDVCGKLFDTMIAHYLLYPEQRHNMDSLAEAFLNYKTIHIESIIGKKGRNQASMRMADKKSLTDYACEDADITLQLKEIFEPLLLKNEQIKLFEETEIPLIKVLAAIEYEGVRIDTKTLKEYSLQLIKENLAIEQEIYECAGTTFNIASPKQLGDILYNKLKITDKPAKTTTKQFSTAEEVLSKLENKHPIVSKILEYRELMKLRSTYIDPLPLMVNKVSGRLHASFNQAVTSTGRLSSNNPNLQNIPIRTERGREIRKAFVPRDNKHILISADYSQIELRIIASLAGDKQMSEDFINGLDIHTATAARVYGIKLEEVTKELRRNAKTVNFGIIYGISAFGLSERLGITRNEATGIINQYFEKYPSIKKYMDDKIFEAREKGFVETILGRRRYIKDINSSNTNIRGFAERNAINAPIQGSAADMIKVAMIRIWEEMNLLKLKSKMILQVHDELVFDVFIPEKDVLTEMITKHMKNALPLSVPVEIEISAGNNWLEAH